MAVRKPLVHLDDNTVGELPAGDTLPGTFPRMEYIADVATDDPAALRTALNSLLAEARSSGRMSPPPMGLSGTYPNALVGQGYNHALTLTGSYVAPVTFAVINGAEPAGPGWGFNTGTSALTNADPQTVESATFSVQATDSSVPPQVVEAGPFTVNVSGGVETGQLGDTGSGGAGNWPTSANRGLLRKITVPFAITLKQFNMRIRGASTGVGDRFKGLVYAADGAGGEPGTLLAVSAPTATTSGGAQLLTATVADVVIPAGEVWIGYVCDGGSGSGSETDSGGTATNATIMLNGGETNYATPTNPCGDWPGSPGPYSNIPALWFDYEYIPGG